MDLPFRRWYADSDRAIALLYSVDSKFSQKNRDHGTELLLAWVPPEADHGQTHQRFLEAYDYYPVRIFRAEGSAVFYMGIYLLTRKDRKVGLWRFRLLNDAWHAHYHDVKTWMRMLGGTKPHIPQKRARPPPDPYEPGEVEEQDPAEEDRRCADY
jgi:hypothetical protein